MCDQWGQIVKINKKCGHGGATTLRQRQCCMRSPVRRGELPSEFLAFALQPQRRRKWAFSRRLLLTAKKSGVSPLPVVRSQVLGLEAERNSSHHTGSEEEINVFLGSIGGEGGVYRSGLFLRCSCLTALLPYAEEASHSHRLHQRQDGTWQNVPEHLPYLVTGKTKEIHIWRPQEARTLLKSTTKASVNEQNPSTVFNDRHLSTS